MFELDKNIKTLRLKLDANNKFTEFTNQDTENLPRILDYLNVNEMHLGSLILSGRNLTKQPLGFMFLSILFHYYRDIVKLSDKIILETDTEFLFFQDSHIELYIEKFKEIGIPLEVVIQIGGQYDTVTKYFSTFYNAKNKTYMDQLLEFFKNNENNCKIEILVGEYNIKNIMQIFTKLVQTFLQNKIDISKISVNDQLAQEENSESYKDLLNLEIALVTKIIPEGEQLAYLYGLEPDIFSNVKINYFDTTYDQEIKVSNFEVKALTQPNHDTKLNILHNLYKMEYHIL